MENYEHLWYFFSTISSGDLGMMNHRIPVGPTVFGPLWGRFFLHRQKRQQQIPHVTGMCYDMVKKNLLLPTGFLRFILHTKQWLADGWWTGVNWVALHIRPALPFKALPLKALPFRCLHRGLKHLLLQLVGNDPQQMDIIGINIGYWCVYNLI